MIKNYKECFNYDADFKSLEQIAFENKETKTVKYSVMFSRSDKNDEYEHSRHDNLQDAYNACKDAECEILKELENNRYVSDNIQVHIFIVLTAYDKFNETVDIEELYTFQYNVISFEISKNDKKEASLSNSDIAYYIYDELEGIEEFMSLKDILEDIDIARDEDAECEILTKEEKMKIKNDFKKGFEELLSEMRREKNEKNQ